MLHALLEGLSRQVPSQCAVCHAWPARRVCDACVARFAAPHHRCPTCALRVAAHGETCRECEHAKPPLDACWTAVTYGFPWSGIVQSYKFHGHSAWSRTMAQLLLAAPGVESALAAADMVIPMPLSTERLKQRGFDQSALLAAALSPDLARTGVLLRILDTPAQSSLSRRERIRNVQSAYAVEPAHYQDLRGKHVLLVDDVMTSGASLGAAAAVLRAAGVPTITGIVFARAEAWSDAEATQ